jgi:hypothetical protein
MAQTSKFGGKMGEDAVAAMKNWASRLEKEELAPKLWYQDWGFLAKGGGENRTEMDRINTVEAELKVLEAKAKAEGWKETSNGIYGVGVSPEAHVNGVWASKRRSRNDPFVSPTDPY